MPPHLSYTIWFSQRTGSTLLSRALTATGMAGRPGEWLYTGDTGLMTHYGRADVAELQAHLWELGSTDNGVFGLKHAFHEPHFSRVLATLGTLPGSPPPSAPRAAVWAHAFPHHRHIFMTRRNKVRLAVSWWKAIRTQEWHRELDAPAAPSAQPAPDDGYSFDAINHLLCEATLREAGIQEFFAEAGIVPLTVVYEDFSADYAGTLRRVLDFLDLDAANAPIPPPPLAPTADAVNEAWVQRFREERQEGWENRGW